MRFLKAVVLVRFVEELMLVFERLTIQWIHIVRTVCLTALVEIQKCLLLISVSATCKIVAWWLPQYLLVLV